MPTYDATDLFAGPGGWEALSRKRSIGIEIDASACATRRMAGLSTIEGDVRKFSPLDMPRTLGLIASPPCPTFSRAGKGSGRESIPAIVQAVKDMGTSGTGEEVHLFEDERTDLVLEPIRWFLRAHFAGRPYEWITLEQVPDVQPIWDAMALVLAGIGYSVETASLNAEQFGVPQTRKRAILVASRTRKARLPTPTHSQFHNRTPARLDAGVEKWVSMAEALDWGRPETYPILTNGTGKHAAVRSSRHPAPTIHFGGRLNSVSWSKDILVGFPRRYDGGSGGPVTINGTDYRRRDLRSATEPAFTVTEKARSWKRYDVDRGAVAAEVEHGTLPDGQARLNNQSGSKFDFAWPVDRPAPVIAGRGMVTMPGANANRFNGSTKSRNDGVRITQEEAGVLQSFPADYPWQGTKTEQFQQIGNAIPCILAESVIRQVAA